VTRAAWFKLAFYTFILVMSAGVYLNFGLGWALRTLGFVGGAAVLAIHDVDEKDGKK
jgi:hypothetical protein